MKRFIFAIMLLLPFAASAQDSIAVVTPHFGILSYGSLLKDMPEYAGAMAQVDSLRMAYDKETQRTESEFQRKFAEFLQGQKEFPLNIMQKRQKELQDLMEQGIAFRHEVQKLLAEAESDVLKPIKARLDAAIKAVGSEMHLSFIFNIDEGTLPFIGEDGDVVDVTPMIQELVK